MWRRLLPALRELAPRNYGLHTAQQLVRLAQHSVSSGVALSARSTSLKILCDQLEHTQANLVQLEQELENLLKTDAGAKGLQSVPEFAAKTVAILRAELGDVDRFANSNQAVAYAGLDIAVKQSGKWKGEAKLSKRGSGRIRRILYMAVVRSIRLKDSAFGSYYHHLVARGLKGRAAMMAVMRKMLVVAYRLLKTQEMYDPTKVFAQLVVHSPASEPQAVHSQMTSVGA
jgi:transposase